MRRKHIFETNKKNPRWLGSSVGYSGIHHWVRRRKLKPDLCEKCHVRKAIDLANISGKYLRDVNDFQYLCRSCHMSSDNRVKNFHGIKAYTKTKFWRYGEKSSNWKGGLRSQDPKKYMHEWYLKRKAMGVYG